ncbi:MAG: neutral/alkaline non-lysosomal ceramidase N-terminal domain-containing protein [Dehalococcoidia bacterium]
MPKLVAGAAKRIITPEENLRLAGYGPVFRPLPWSHRVATGVHDDIFARCLALGDGQKTLAFVVLDLISLYQVDMETIRTRAREKTGRQDLMVAVGTTHNHSAPDVTGAYGGVPKRYKRLIHERASDAVAEAVANLAPARIGFATTRVEGIVRNNRHPEAGPVDEELAVMLVEGKGDATLAVLVNFACHADVLGKRNTLITADFPGYLRRDLERERGGTAIFFNAAQGDLYPRQTIEDHDDEKGLRTFEEAQAVGSAIAKAALAALAKAKLTSDVTIDARVTYPELPVENRMLKIARLLRMVPRKLYKGRVRSEVWAVSINDAEIVTLPGQFLCALGLELKQQMKGTYKFLFGLTGDDLVYVLPPEEWDPSRKGEEETLSLGINTWPVIKEQLPPL